MIENETIEQKWERELKVLLESKNLDEMAKHPYVTDGIYRWMQVFNIGYLVFGIVNKVEKILLLLILA